MQDTFRREVHAQKMNDLRHIAKEEYAEGETEDNKGFDADGYGFTVVSYLLVGNADIIEVSQGL